MKKLMAFVVALMFLFAPLAYAGKGPAPNSGDGVSDGSGFNPAPSGPGTDSASGPRGPAPNSGDGIPDGPGWEELEDLM